jgi:hypothetical protein
LGFLLLKWKQDLPISAEGESDTGRRKAPWTWEMEQMTKQQGTVVLFAPRSRGSMLPDGYIVSRSVPV